MPPSINLIWPSYKPPQKTPEENLKARLRSRVHSMYLTYNSRAEEIESLARRIDEIVQKTVGEGNEQAKISVGHQKSMQIFNNQREGRAFLISTTDSSAYTFLIQPQNFTGTALNLEIINQGIANLKCKATECRAASELFSTINNDQSFQTNPIEYIEIWRKTREKPSVAEKKVLKHLV